LVDGWLFFHFFVGALIGVAAGASLPEVAKDGLIPVLAIFVGLTFSWAGNAHALLQSEEIIRFAEGNAAGISEYVHVFQLCILVVLFTAFVWLIPSLEIPYLLPGSTRATFDALSSWFLFSLLSLAVRTSWQTVLGTNLLLVTRALMIRKSRGGAASEAPPKTPTPTKPPKQKNSRSASKRSKR
jgi:hypothetical protein